MVAAIISLPPSVPFYTPLPYSAHRGKKGRRTAGGKKQEGKKGKKRRGLICPPLAFTNGDKVLPRFVIRCWALSISCGLRCFDKKRKARVGVASFFCVQTGGRGRRGEKGTHSSPPFQCSTTWGQREGPYPASILISYT